MALVWIGHVPGDAIKARRIGVALGRVGHRVWFDDEQARAGEVPTATLARGLAKADAAIICLSQAAVEGGWIDVASAVIAHGKVGTTVVAQLEFVSPRPPRLAAWPSFELRWDDATWTAGAAALVDALAEGAAAREQSRLLEIDRALAPCPPEALTLLREAARFAPREVPLAWVLGPVAEGLLADERAQVLDTLAALGLLRISPDRLTVSLEQAVWRRVREQTPTDTALGMTRRASAQLLETRSTKAERRQFHAHLEQLVEDGRGMDDRELWASLASLVGLQLSNCGERNAGRILLEQTLPIIEEDLPDSAKVATAIFNVLFSGYIKKQDGGALRQLVDGFIARFTEARPPAPEYDLEVAKACMVVGAMAFAYRLLSRTLSSVEQHAAIDDTVYLGILYQSSRLAVINRDYHKAKELAEKALPHIAAAKGSSSEMAARQLAVLGDAFVNQQDLPGAIAAYQRALVIFEQIHGVNNPKLIEQLAPLARAAHQAGDAVTVQRCVERARSIAVALQGTEHSPAAAIQLSLFAQTLQTIGQTEEARTALDQAYAAAGTFFDDTLLGPFVEFALFLTAHGLDTKGESFTAPSPGAAATAVTAAMARLQDDSSSPGDQLAAILHAESTALTAEDWANAARAAYLLGDAHGRKGGWEQARSAIERGLLYARRTTDVRLIAEGYRLHGDACLQGSDYETARLDYEEAIRHFGALGEPQRSYRVRLVLLALLLQLNRATEAAPHVAAIAAALSGGGLAHEDRAQAEELLALVRQAKLAAAPPADTQAPQ